MYSNRTVRQAIPLIHLGLAFCLCDSNRQSSLLNKKVQNFSEMVESGGIRAWVRVPRQSILMRCSQFRIFGTSSATENLWRLQTPIRRRLEQLHLTILPEGYSEQFYKNHR